MFGDNKVLVALWVHFQFIRESMVLTRYRETPQGQAEQDRVSRQQQKAYIRRLRGEA